MESSSSSRTREVTFGRSLIVPSVQEIVTKQPLLTKLPPRYNQQYSLVSAAGNSSSLSVPVINLQSLINGDAAELDTLHTACQQWGFFQVVQHGVSSLLLEDFKREIFYFFKLPLEEKKKLWQQPENHEGFGQLFVVSDTQKLDWSDMFYITTLPSDLRRPHLFEHLSPNLRETLEAYSLEVKKLAMTILGHIAKALKMDEEEMREMFSDGVQSMRMNYYPPCPEPDKAIGFTPHSDADALTILFQLNETEGLQIRKDGRWLPVKPLPDAFVVNLGDIMEIVSNGVYQSIEHRATVNSTTERLSVATFYSSNMDCELGPARSLIGPDKPAVYQRVPIETYFKEFFARKLDGKAYLDFMKTEEHVTT